MGLLTGKTALITGATRGIGRATALMFASEGADIAFTYRSQHEAAESLKAEIEGMGVRAKPIHRMLHPLMTHIKSWRMSRRLSAA